MSYTARHSDVDQGKTDFTRSGLSQGFQLELQQALYDLGFPEQVHVEQS